MPDVETYSFSHKEIIELMIRASGVHEGEWMLQVNFGFTAGNFGSNDENLVPGAITIVNHMGITRAKQGAPSGLVLDAAKVNPRAPS